VNATRFPDSEALYGAAARLVETVAAEAIAARGRFRIALAGGTTPRPLYQRLSRSERIDWPHVHVFWSDERCVPSEDPASNAGAARRDLLDRVPVPPSQIHRIEGEHRPIEAADAYEALLRRELGEDGRLDLVLLGLGVDGHTASLFPEQPALSEVHRWILPVRVDAQPPWRVTMTLPLIRRARNVLLLATGTEKAEVVSRIEGGERLPAGRVAPRRGRLTWMIDREAGG